jgi:hypothetical protein
MTNPLAILVTVVVLIVKRVATGEQVAKDAPASR